MSTRNKLMIRISRIVFIILTSVTYECKCNSCPATTPTVQMVNRCPTTEEEWNAASSRKKCDHLADYKGCGKTLVYHCLVNQWGNNTLEVCAPPWYISGFCPMFNTIEQRVIDNFNIDCTKFLNESCPTRYLSSEAYKYQLCYQKQLTSSSKSSTNVLGHKDAHNTQSNITGSNNDELPLTVTVILMGIAVLVLIVLLALTWTGKIGRKGCRCHRDINNTELENTALLIPKDSRKTAGQSGHEHLDQKIDQHTTRHHGHAGKEDVDRKNDHPRYSSRTEETAMQRNRHHDGAEDNDTEPLLFGEEIKDSKSMSTVVGGETYADQIGARQKDLYMLADAKLVTQRTSDKLKSRDEKHVTSPETNGDEIVQRSDIPDEINQTHDDPNIVTHSNNESEETCMQNVFNSHSTEAPYSVDKRNEESEPFGVENTYDDELKTSVSSKTSLKENGVSESEMSSTHSYQVDTERNTEEQK